MIYHCTPFKTTMKPNIALWLSLFLDKHLHVQAAVFPCGILCMRYLFFLFKKEPHPCFYCIITYPIIPSRGFSSCSNTVHTVRYCWYKNHLSKYLYPSTILQIVSFQSIALCFSWDWVTHLLLLVILKCFEQEDKCYCHCVYKVTFQNQTTLEVNDKSVRF